MPGTAVQPAGQNVIDWLLSAWHGVTQPFGCTTYSGETPRPSCPGGYFHSGVDIGFRTGSPVLAPTEGRVVYAGYDNSGYGRHVIVATPSGWKYLVGHLTEIGVSVGQGVAVSDLLGTTGGGTNDPQRGNSDGPHLHFEVRDQRGNPVPIGGSTLQGVADWISTKWGYNRPTTGHTGHSDTYEVPAWYNGWTTPNRGTVPGDVQPPSPIRDPATNPGSSTSGNNANAGTSAASACTPPGASTIPDVGGWIGYAICVAGSAVGGLPNWFATELGAPLLVIVLGLVFMTVGVVKLGSENKTVVNVAKLAAKAV